MLHTVTFRGAPPGDAGRHPFDLPALAGLERLELGGPVTLLAGENGSGKSTLLEALAVAAELPTVGSRPAHQDPSLAAPARLAASLRLGWRPRLRRGFFLRAEDVFGFILALRRTMREMEGELGEAAERLADASEYGRQLGLGPHRASLAALRRRYGESPDARSHGETFLHLFRERLAPGGLYLLDEPEAALSPQSQLALVSLLARAVDEGSQLVIATHSPLLLALPGATILSFDARPVAPARWEELPSVTLWRDVLEAPERYLRHLWAAGRPGGGGGNPGT